MDRTISRRSILKGGAVVAGAAGMMSFSGLLAAAPALQFGSDLDILNYALTLEHLEYAFYRDGLNGLGAGAFSALPTFGGQSALASFQAIRDHEGQHVQTLIQVIQSLGGTPVAEAKYNFGYSNVAGFVKVADALENTGVSAYDGAIRYVQNPDLKQAAATIATVEARHAAYLNLLTGTSPFPAAFDTPKSKDEILAIAGPFIVGSGAAAPSAPASGSASISAPSGNISGSNTITGTAVLGPNDAFYKVVIMGGQFTDWTTVGTTHTSSVSNGTLETLGPLPAGSYQLRVIVVAKDSNFSQVSAPVSISAS